MKYTLLLLFVVLSFIGCDEDSTASSPTQTIPTMSGRWDVTWTSTTNTITGLMDLTENNGSLSGTLTIANAPLSIGGTVSLKCEVSIGGSDNSGRLWITGTTTSDKNSFSGKMDMWDRKTNPETYKGYLNMTASKR